MTQLVSLGDSDIREVIGSVTGKVNGIAIEEGALMASIAYTSGIVKASVQLKEIPKPLIHPMRSVISFLVPVYWATVRQGNTKLSGVDITNGVFTYTGQVISYSFLSLHHIGPPLQVFP